MCACSRPVAKKQPIGNDLADRLHRAAKSSAIRLDSQFDAADHDLWEQVLDEARKGTSKLKAVGHTQEADKDPVCQAARPQRPRQKRRRNSRPLRCAALWLAARRHRRCPVRAAGSGPPQSQRCGLKARGCQKPGPRQEVTQTHFQRESMHLPPGSTGLLFMRVAAGPAEERAKPRQRRTRATRSTQAHAPASH